MKDGHVEALYEAHARGIFAFLAYRTGDRALAEDLLADTFERVIRTRKRPAKAGKAWLYTVALNILRDHARRARVEQRALTEAGADVSEAVPAVADAVADREAVMRAVRTLSSEEQEAIALRFGAGLTVPEIASVLGEPLPRTEGRVYRALRKLRPVLEREYSH